MDYSLTALSPFSSQYPWLLNTLLHSVLAPAGLQGNICCWNFILQLQSDANYENYYVIQNSRFRKEADA